MATANVWSGDRAGKGIEAAHRGIGAVLIRCGCIAAIGLVQLQHTDEVSTNEEALIGPRHAAGHFADEPERLIVKRSEAYRQHIPFGKDSSQNQAYTDR